MANIAAIIAGAGAGTRLGANIPKALVSLAGEALIVHAVRGMQKAGITEIIVTAPEKYLTEFSRALNSAGLSAKVIPGGATRQESVANGIAATKADFVLVHDAARALTPSKTISTVVAALNAGAKAVIPALPVKDTIKSGIFVKNDDLPAESSEKYVSENVLQNRHNQKISGTEKLIVEKTLNRAALYAIQTPQGFAREVLLQAHEAGKHLSASEASAAPDDAALVELLGIPVEIVPGHENALKITTPLDLVVANLLYTNEATEK